MRLLTRDTRISPSLSLNDATAFDLAGFQILIESDIAAGDVRDVDDIRFMQDYALVLPNAVRFVSLNPEVQNPSAAEFNMPKNGDQLYGQRLTIHRPGFIAIQEQPSDDGGVDSDGNALQNQVGYIPESTDVGQTTYTGESTAPVRTNLRIHALTAATSGNEPLYALYDASSGNYVAFNGDNSGVTGFTSSFFYISEFRETVTWNDGANDFQKSVPVIVPATRYPHIVAQDFFTEPFYYMPGYAFVNQLTIEHNSDQLFQTTGEYSWFQNQLTRLHGKKDEDARLAHAYSLEANFVNHPFSVQEALRKHPGPSKTARTTFTNGIQVAQQYTRDEDCVYCPLVHPFNSPSTGIPMPNVFANNIEFHFSVRSVSDVLVIPGGSDTRYPQNSVRFDSSTVVVRPQNSDTKLSYTNEEIQRLAVGSLPSSKELGQSDEKVKTRMEIIVVTLSQEEQQQLGNSKLTNVTRQPQVKHHTVSHTDAADNARTFGVNFEDTPAGMISSYTVVGRQKKAMDKGMLYDLAAFADSVTGLPVPAIYGVAYSYDSSQRTSMRDNAKGTSSHLLRHLYAIIPHQIVPHSLHVLTAGFRPKEPELSGVSMAHKARALRFNVELTTDAFKYDDPFTPDADNTPTDVVISVFMDMFQLFNFNMGQLYRSLTAPSVCPAT